MKFAFHEQLENKPNPSSATKSIKHYICGTLKRDIQKIKLPNCSRKFQRHRTQKRHAPTFWLRLLSLQRTKKNREQFREHLWTSWQKDHRAQNLFRSQTHALNGFSTAYTVKTKIEKSPMFMNVHENRHHVHEMFIIYALETYCPRNQKKLTFS